MIFLTVGNFGYLEFTKNNILNFQKPFLQKHQLHIVCLDSTSFKILRRWIGKKQFRNITLLDREIEIEDFSKYGSPNFNFLTRHKLKVIREFAAQHQGLFYLDGDVVFFGDPEPFILQKPDKDIIFQSESLADPYGTWQCTGCFYIQNNLRSLSFLDEVIKSSSPFADKNDQEILQIYLKRNHIQDIRKFPNINLDIFDPSVFQNGKVAIDLMWAKLPNCVSVHANYRIGKRPKIKGLMLCSAWFHFDPSSGVQWRCQIELLLKRTKKFFNNLLYVPKL